MAITDEDYEGSFRIPAPKGIYQGAGDTNISPEYAYIAENIRTERGLLASSYGTSSALPPLGEPIGTLARFYRRTRPDDPEIFVAAAGGGIYTYTEGTEGWVQRGSGFTSDRWSLCDLRDGGRREDDRRAPALQRRGRHGGSLREQSAR